MESEKYNPRSEIQVRDFAVEEKINSMLMELDEDDIKRTKERIHELPPEIQEVIGSDEENILSVLHHKFEVTFDHSFAVAEIANKQYDEFAKDLEDAGVSRESYLRAALLHDLGKLGLPDAILKTPLNNGDFYNIFMANIDNQEDFTIGKLSINSKTVEELSVDDHQNNDYRDLVSLTQCFEGDEEAMKEILKYGIDPDNTSFMDALKMHQQLSEQIVKKMDIPDRDTVAELVGSHHHYSRVNNERYGVPSELLHLADVYQAIVQFRKYDKHEDSQIDALYIIMEQTEQGEFPVFVAKRWMKNMMLDKYDIPAEETGQFEKLQDFLAS